MVLDTYHSVTLVDDGMVYQKPGYDLLMNAIFTGIV